MEIKPIHIPRSVIKDIPPPVVQSTEIPRPVVRGIAPPSIRVPEVIIDYPTIDVPTKEEFEGAVAPPKEEQPVQTEPNRTVSPPQPPAPPAPPVEPVETVEPAPAINVGGVDVPIPDPGPLVAAGSLAVVTTAVTLGSTIVFTQLKTAAEPMIKNAVQNMMGGKKKKVKIKQVKPVLHFIQNEDGTAEIIQYSAKGMSVVQDNITNLEQYLRDQVDIDSLYEFDNKLLIDEDLTKSFTKEGQKRFKRHIIKPKAIAKKLGAKFSF